MFWVKKPINSWINWVRIWNIEFYHFIPTTFKSNPWSVVDPLSFSKYILIKYPFYTIIIVETAFK
jgi:hypothetical protein